MKINRSSEKLNFFQLVEIIEEDYLFNPDYTETALPSYERMAEQFGVSKVTAENAVKFLKEVDLLRSEVGRGTFINREPVQDIETKNIYMVSLDAFNPQNSFFHKQLSGEMTRAVAQRGLHFEYRYITNTHRQTNYVDLHRLVRTAGNAFVFLGDNPDYHSLLDVLERRGQPFVHIGKSETPEYPHLRSIILREDIRTSIHLAMQHLSDLGHRNIALLGVNNYDTSQMRIDAYRDYMVQKLPGSIPQIITETGSESDIQTGWRLLSGALEKNRDFTALVTLNDRLAAGAIIALKDHGIRVPEEVSVVGYDNELGLVDDFVPTITSVEYDRSRMAENIFARLLDDLPAVPFSQQLYARESSAPA